MSIGLGNKVMNAITLMATLASTRLVGLHLGDRDGLWEVTCAPHSWLSQAAESLDLRPRVINLHNGYDLYKADTWDRLRDLRRIKRPGKIWFSLPCTKWCPWNYMHYKQSGRDEQLETARRKERRMLWHVNQFVKEAITEDPMVMIYFEWPTQCIGWSQRPMEDLKDYMHYHEIPWSNCRIDGCRYGLCDKESGEFIHKRWTIRTNDEDLHRVYRAKVCTGGHVHAHRQGDDVDIETYYPWKLVQSICRFWRDKLSPTRHLRLLQRRDDLPAEVEEPGSEYPPDNDYFNEEFEDDNNVVPQDIVTDDDNNVYMREMDRLTLKSLFDEATQKEKFNFETLEGLMEEFFNLYDKHGKEEYQKWQAQIAKFHKAAGHPTNRNLAKIIKDAGHPEWKIEEARKFYCPSCESLRPGGISSGQVPPASTHSQFQAWEAVTVDSAEWIPPGKKKKVKFLLFMDVATKLRAAHVLYHCDFLEMRAESGGDFIKAFSERWLSMFPRPRVLILDSARSFMSEQTSEFLTDLQILVHYVAEKEPWANGVIEAAVQDVKHTASAIYLEAMDVDLTVTLNMAISALNATEFTAGYSAHQWAFGASHQPTDEDRMALELVDPKSDFARLVTCRQRAEEIARQAKAKRTLTKLNNTSVRQPLRQFSPLDLVKVWRKVWPKEQHAGPRGGFKKSGRPHWIGPGRVLFQEALPHQRHGEERMHVVWVLVGSQLLRCSVHSVRPVTETERFQHEISTEEDFTQWRSLKDVLPRKEYTDLTEQAPNADEKELPNLPSSPDPTTMVTPHRRLRQKVTYRPGEYQQQPVAERLQRQDVEEDMNQPEPATSSSATPSTILLPVPTDVNEYLEPEMKRARVDESGNIMDYDLHWVQELEAEPTTQEPNNDIFTVMEDVNEFLKIEFDIPTVWSNRQKKMFERHPVAYMVKKMRDSEVSLSRLSPAERQLFIRAKAKEVDSFIKNDAVRKCMDDKEIREAYESQRIVKARWVLTWKLVPPEDRDEALKDASDNPGTTLHDRQGRRKAKARIVLGFQHPSLLDPTFKTSSPVQSMLGRNLLYLMSAQHGWPLEGLDLATAFLQTMPTEADARLWTSGVEELRQALDVGSEGILRILQNIYGSTTAPRGLWLDLHKTLTSLGATAIVGERCLWIWHSSHERDGDFPRTIGAMGGHVDDFHRIGDDNSAEWQAIKEKINNAYKWGMTKRKNYRHAGTDVSTTTDPHGNMKIVVDQDYYVESIMDVDIKPERLACDGTMSSQEVAACRTALGALQWLAVQTQPQLCSRCNLLLTEVVTKAQLQTAREIQQMIAEVRNESYKLEFFKLRTARHWSELTFVSMGDQAHANRDKGDSTGGLLTLAAGPEAGQGRVCPMCLIAWRTWKLKRKAIGSNDAEVQAILEAEDQNFRVRLLWTELHGRGHPRQLRDDLVSSSEGQAMAVKGILCTDSRGGYDAVERNESPLLGLSNMRAALQTFQLRDNLRRVACELRWVASDYDLADAMTKKKPESRVGLLTFLKTWLWSVAFDPTFTSAKRSKQKGQSAVGRIAKHIKHSHD
ncbi:Copia protein [Symbiodinium microadriaticum]|uniref:Copia protein n=1 Tax=Symbiodinium microadriaticum TaxID=2951 RepID=A0A1Q9DHZ1_SYMMI|nr:Copia protein [Symbiodinium microadriaticum]